MALLLKEDRIEISIPNSEASICAQHEGIKDRSVGSYYMSDIYENVKKKYDFIVTNPPIRAGKEIVYRILFGAKDYLLPGGVLYFVVNKNQGAKSMVRDLEKVAKVDILKKHKGFFVIKCIFDWQVDIFMVII